jgi:hypothetical protein
MKLVSNLFNVTKWPKVIPYQHKHWHIDIFNSGTALQVWNPEFKPQVLPKKKEKKSQENKF